MLNDTIAAIATPLGEGGLAVVRVSGPEALAVAGRCFAPAGRNNLSPAAAASHTVHFGHIVRDGQKLDEVLLTVLRAPRTMTREDVVEISCHGGLLPAKLVLDTLLSQGARLAHPGEFTQRAFLNGRIDLTQAEAVNDLIHSRTELALAMASEQLSGKLSRLINQMRDRLLGLMAQVEAHIDFPEEDIAPQTREQLLRELSESTAQMERLLETAREGRILRQGISVAIIGLPNAGKSSLLNQLLGFDRAIISPQAGTTRDTIEVFANLRGLPLLLTDTAGLREAADPIEQEGVRRSLEALARADLVLQVVDASQNRAASADPPLPGLKGKARIRILNKIDLPGAHLEFEPDGIPTIPVSCQTGQGIEALKEAIKKLVWAGGVAAEMLEVMINSRHQELLAKARQSAHAAAAGLQDALPLELAAMDLRRAINFLGEIVGKTITEDLLDSIFSQFCIGK